ncbi:hypothetical protein ACWKW6_12905 [Dyadobacter jiangsuensis]
MQALTQIGFTEKDFELAFNLIEKQTKSNKILSGQTTLKVELGIHDPFGRMLADQLQSQFRNDQGKARQENDELVGLQYKMIQLKKLIAQDGANRQSMD